MTDDLLTRLRQVEGETTHYYRNPEGPEAADEIERLRARVAKLESRASDPREGRNTMKLNWQPIDTAPKDGTQILLCQATDGDGKIINDSAWGLFIQVAAWWPEEYGGSWVVYCSQIEEPPLHFDPTHWAPLPLNPLETNP